VDGLLAGSVDPEQDVAALATPAAPAERPHGLTVADTVSVPAEVLAPLEQYVAGHATGDPAHHRRAFLPGAHIEGIREGRFVSWDLDEFCSLFPGRPAEDEPQRRRRIDEVRVAGTVATASMTLWHGPDLFTDVFLLVRTDGRWAIANKAYHRAG
jgi:hypothetical protein